MDLSEDTKAIVASNLTTALAILVAKGEKEKEAKKIIKLWFGDLYVPPLEGKLLYPELED